MSCVPKGRKKRAAIGASSLGTESAGIWTQDL